MVDQTNIEKPSANHRKRVPLGTRNVLTAPKKSGFVRRYVNDEPDRIQMFKDAGYVVVDENLPVGDPKIGQASSLGRITNPSVGGGKKAILMEIKQEYYDEDQAAKVAKIKKIEDEMKRNTRPSSDAENFGKVSIS